MDGSRRSPLRLSGTSARSSISTPGSMGRRRRLSCVMRRWRSSREECRRAGQLSMVRMKLRLTWMRSWIEVVNIETQILTCQVQIHEWKYGVFIRDSMSVRPSEPGLSGCFFGLLNYPNLLGNRCQGVDQPVLKSYDTSWLETPSSRCTYSDRPRRVWDCTVT